MSLWGNGEYVHTQQIEEKRKHVGRRMSDRQKALAELCLNCTKDDCKRKCEDYKRIENLCKHIKHVKERS